jgi:hypothetical protein
MEVFGRSILAAGRSVNQGEDGEGGEDGEVGEEATMEEKSSVFSALHRLHAILESG